MINSIVAGNAVTGTPGNPNNPKPVQAIINHSKKNISQMKSKTKQNKTKTIQLCKQQSKSNKTSSIAYNRIKKKRAKSLIKKLKNGWKKSHRCKKPNNNKNKI